jgi:CRP-like cAMP-binding protein
MDKELKILDKVSLFSGIESTKLVSTLECLEGKVKQYIKNQLIIVAGEEITSLGIVLKGNIQIVREDIMGNRMIVAGLEDGEIFAETFACAGVKQSPVSVIAYDECKILWIPVRRIIAPNSYDQNLNSCLITNLLQLLARKNLYLNEKMELLAKRNIREKIMAYLALQAEKHNASSFEISLNRNEMADFLCIDRSAMSRELSKLKEEGVIEYRKNYFNII